MHKSKILYRNVGSVRIKNGIKTVRSVPMKVGWVSKYDTSMIQCLCFFCSGVGGRDGNP